MIKSTAKELKKDARFTSKKELQDFLKSNGLKVVAVDIVAYCVTTYGCGGYLISYTLNIGATVKAFTGRSSWMYTCDNMHDLGAEFYA